MKNKSGFEDKRLLESLEFIDEKYISETMENYDHVPEVSGNPQTDKRVVRRTLRQVVALAACLVLLSAAIPLATNLIRNHVSESGPSDGVGNGQFDIPNESNSVETREPNNDQPNKADTGTVFDGTPIFKVRNNDSANSARVEAYRADGTKIDLCICNSAPCTCGKNSGFLTCGNMIWTVETSANGETTFIAFDISDPDSINYTRVKVEGFSIDTHYIIAVDGTPYYYARLMPTPGQSVIEGLIILDMSDAINGNVVCRDYPSYKTPSGGVDGETQLLYVDGDAVYFGIIDKDTNAITRIVRALPGEKQTTPLFEVDNVWHFGMMTELIVDADDTVYFFREEMDTVSEYGYSLYQYIWREGGEVEKVLRATNICDYIIADGYIFYTVNAPANVREFKNFDTNHIYTDMTGGKIYSLSASDIGAEPMLAWTLGEEYYLYGVTEYNKPTGKLHNRVSNVASLIQGVDGGIAIQANKQVGENIMHVYLLIGDSGNKIVMTELPGCPTWGYCVLSDSGGGSNINYEYRPESYSASGKADKTTLTQAELDEILKKAEEELEKEHGES